MNTNNIWVGGIRSTIKASSSFLNFAFPIVVAVDISLLCLSRYWSYWYCFSGRSQQREMEPLLGLCRLREAGLAGPGITGGRKVGREGLRERNRE